MRKAILTDSRNYLILCKNLFLQDISLSNLVLQALNDDLGLENIRYF